MTIRQPMNELTVKRLKYDPKQGRFEYLDPPMHGHGTFGVRVNKTSKSFILLYSRKALCWGVSNTMDNSFCLEALKEAIARDSRPEIFNTDPGRQLTSDALTGKLKEDNIRIRMDGKGRWRGNVFL